MYLTNAYQRKLTILLQCRGFSKSWLIQGFYSFNPCLVCIGYFPIQKVIITDCQLFGILRYKWGTGVSQNGKPNKLTIWKTLSGKLAQAGRENRLEARVGRIDPIDKEIDVVLYSLDKPLPWEHKQAKGFSIPKKSFEKLLNESYTAEELDSKLRDWWLKRDARAAKRAAKKAQ